MHHQQFYVDFEQPNADMEFQHFALGLTKYRDASAILIQVFFSAVDVSPLDRILSTIVDLLPDAIIIGASSAGDIDGGTLRDGGFLISVTAFTILLYGCITRWVMIAIPWVVS